MKVKVSGATGPVLDWMVAKAEGVSFESYMAAVNWMKRREVSDDEEWAHHAYQYSTSWHSGGPIIEREMREHGFDVWRTDAMSECAASYTRGVPAEYHFGPAPPDRSHALSCGLQAGRRGRCA